MPRFPSRAIAYVLIALSVTVCDRPIGPNPPIPEESVVPQFNVVEAPVPYPILAGAGDVANCTPGNNNDESTAALLDVIFANGQPGNVMQLGEPDESATSENYPGCYVDTWGRHKAITRPMPGNKDYINGNLDHYFRYWGAAAGEAPGGYYSFDAGEYWHVVVINSNNTFVPTNTDAAPQVAWLRNDLLLNTKPCIAAFMHHPRFFSSTTPNVDTEAGSLRAVWNELYKHGTEFVASGNRHHYERLKPMRADGTVDVALGVIQFISGTGGTSLGLPQDGIGSIHPNTDVRGVDYGVVKFTLKPDGYDWQFVPARNRFNDAGSANCHPPTIPVSLRVTSSSPSSVYSQPVTFTAKAEDGTNTVRVGTMSFISGGTCDAPAGVLESDISLDETGRARFTTLALDVAGSPHSIIACYTGAGSYMSSSGEIAHSVERATASVTLAGLAATYDGLAKSATATTAPPDLLVSLAYATAAGDAVAAPIDAGEYTVTATVQDPNYSGSASDLFRIAKATPIITWAQPAPITYGTALGAAQLNATASFNSQTVPGSFTYAPAAGTVLDAGPNQVLSADFTPTVAGNFNSVAGTTVLISVGGASQTIDFAGPGDKTFGDPPFALSATATSGLAVSFSALGACSVAGTTVTIDQAGGCTFTASQGGNTNYQPADDVIRSIVIAKKSATVTLGSLFHNYDGQPKSASASTDAPGESAFHFGYQRNGTAVAQPTDAGSYNVVATLINANYQGSASGTLVINAGPVATADAYSVDEDGALSIAPPGVLGNDVDSDGGAIAPSLVSSTSNGTLQFNADGSFAYAPGRDFNGSDAFSYRISDGNLSSDPVTVTITVNAVNDAPVATPDSYTTAEDQVLSIAAPGVLANDTDVDGGAILAELATAPAHGTLVLAASGSFTYTPNDGFSGDDSFTYKAFDGSASSEIVTVTITVTSVNSAPSVVDDPSYTVDEDQTLTTAVTASVLANDSDGDRDPLTAELVEGPAPAVTATFTLNPNGTFSFQPAPEFFGTTTFTYRATDGIAVSGSATVTITVNGINDAPSFGVGPDQTVAEDAGPQTVVGWASTISAGPANESSQTLAFDITTNTNSALFATQPAVSPAGALTYTPAANANGEATLTVVLRDNGGTAGGGVDASTSQTFTVRVSAVNDVPVANAQSVSTAEDTPVSITLTASDIEGDALTFEITAGPTNGSLAPTGTPGTYTYTPNANFNGTDEFAFTASDGTPCDPATVTIGVGTVNDAPVASDDQYAVDEDNVLSAAGVQSVLANDADADGDPLTASLVADRGPSNGTVAFSADGTFTYTPNPNFHGVDGFTYQATDGQGGTAPATVAITVNAVNDAPAAADDQGYAVSEDQTLTTTASTGVLANDTDVDDTQLTATVVTPPVSGSLTLNADGSFTYTPNADFSGTDSFEYRASDGRLTSNVATVTIAVGAANDAPVAGDDAFDAVEDTPRTLSVLANDSDPEASPLTPELVDGQGPTNGTVRLNADGTFTYTPNADFNGSDGFSYTVSDGSATSNAARVTITVAPVNDAPVAAAQTVSTEEDTPKTITLAAEDQDGDQLTYRVTAQPSHGTLSGEGNVYAYTPAANYQGSDAFSFVVNDGTEDSEQATVSIAVAPKNDAPVAIDNSYSAAEDQPLTVVNTSGVLQNDADIDGDELSALLVSGPTNGTLTLNADGSFTYSPNTNYSGSDSFTYQASDGVLQSNVATVAITVTAVNDGPVADAQSVATTEDAPVSIGLTGSDVDGDALTFSITTPPAHGSLSAAASPGTYTYTPNANFSGSDEFTFTASDGTLSAPATVTITVGTVNDVPVTTADQYAFDEDNVLSTAGAQSVLANDADADGDPLTASLVMDRGPSNGTLTFNADGTFTYTPNPNFNGTDEFSYQAADGKGGAAIGIVAITVNPINDAPAATDDPGYTVLEDQTLTTTAVTGVLVNDSDIDNAQLTATVVTPPAFGSLTLNADGSFTYTPNADFNGTDAFEYRASDGGLTSNVATVTIAVAAANDAPITADDAFDLVEDTPRTLSVLANDSDAEANPLTPQLVDGQGPANGIVSVNADGTFTYTPNADFNGSDGFSYTVSDGNAISNAARVMITVAPVNDAPVAQPQPVTTDEDKPVTITLAGQDIENSQLAYTITAQPTHGRLSGEGNVYTYTPDANYLGPDAFSFAVNDGTENSAPASVSITVSPVNDIPTATADQYAVDEDKVLTVSAGQSILGNDTDADGDALTASLVVDQGPSSGTLDLNSDGTFTYTPNADFHGTDGFTYQASDGHGGTASTTVTITVNPVNDAPRFVKGGDQSVSENVGPQTVASWATGISAGPADEAGQALSFELTSNTNPELFGAAPAVSPSGTLTYTPAANASGSATITVVLHDDGGTAGGGIDASAAQSFTISVSSVNSAPSFTAGTSQTVAEDAGAQTVLGWATQISAGPSEDDQTLTFTVATSDDARFSALPAIDPATGDLRYTPAANANGSVTVTVTLHDNGGTANGGVDTSPQQTFTITLTPVNDVPVAADNTFSTTEDAPLTIPAAGVLQNDSDVDGDGLSAVLVSGPTNGTLTLNADGSFAYTPNANYSGSDGFTYRASDGALQSNVATVTIAVSALNDQPVAQPQTVTTDEDTPASVTLAGEDAEGNQLSYRITAQPSHGTLSGDGNTYIYTAAANYYGDDAFSFVVNDGTEDSAPAAVSITVRAANDIPTATGDQYAVDEDNALTVAADQGILANDGDVDGDAITAVVVAQPAHGTLTLNADGSFTYTPADNFTGDDGFTYKATDPSGGASATTTVSIAVTPVNDAPAVAPIADQTGAEGTPVTFTAAATDPDANAITFSLVGAPAGATIDAALGAFTWTPSEAQGPATYTFAVKATDNGTPALSGERQVTITVTEANAAPVLGSVGERSVVWGNALTFTATATDADEPANALTFSVPDAPAGATMNGSTGEFSWTPGATQGAGTYLFTVRVSDGVLNVDEQITVTVINPAPSATSMSKTSSAAQTNAPDFVLEVSGDGFAPTSAVQWNGADLATAFVSPTRLTAVVPGSEIATAGTHYVRVLSGAPGGGASDKLAFFVTDAPAPVTASSVGTSESPTGTVQVMTAAASPTDATVKAIATGAGTVAVARYANNPGGTPSFSTVGLWFDVNVENGSSFSEVQISFCNIADGTLVQWWNASAVNGDGSNGAWQPVEPAAQLSGGCLSLTVTGSSKPSLSDLEGDYFGIGKNTAPQAINDVATVAEDGSQTIQVLTNDVDAEGDALSTVIVDGPDHGTLVHNADGSFTYTPAADFNGTDVFTYQASDGSLTSNMATVTITVTAVNDAPTAAADSYDADEDKQLVVAAPGVLANDTDLDGQALSATLVTGPANGTLTLNGNGSFTYTPNLHFSGNDAFSYRATDGLGSSDAVSVAITVKPRMTVLLDIIPGSSTNSIGYSSSQTQIVFAVLSTATFDATLVDPAGTTLGNDQGTDTPLAKNADGSFKFLLADVNGDGRRDFYAYVNKAAMKANGDLTLTTTSMTVLGRLKAPRTELFRGKDKVTVVP